MKKFNLFNEIITAKTSELKQAVESGEKFAINIYGEILTRDLKELDIIIYHGKPESQDDL